MWCYLVTVRRSFKEVHFCFLEGHVIDLKLLISNKTDQLGITSAPSVNPSVPMQVRSKELGRATAGGGSLGHLSGG